MFYTVLEIQQSVGGNPACIPLVYDNYDSALAQYFTICAAAAQSALPYHSAHILRDDGILIKGEIFDRRGEE